MKKSKRPWDWEDSSGVPPTSACIFCDSIAWRYSFQGIRNDDILTVFEKWQCFADETHRLNVLVIDEAEEE